MNGKPPAPDSTAERVALWRALHVQADPPPHIFTDEVGLRLLAPDETWRRRPDMDPTFTRPFRASIVARARFIEDLVIERLHSGLRQYVILGAGLDTFAQRRPPPSAPAWNAPSMEHEPAAPHSSASSHPRKS